MKIIQLLASIDGESPGPIGSTIYGLGDDGSVYELVSPRAPREGRANGNYGPTVYLPGVTGGWLLTCQSHERSEVIPNPDRPQETA